MLKRAWSPTLCVLLVAGVLATTPAGARSPIPAEPNIEDPIGDANYLNDQGQPAAPDFDDNVTGQDVGGAADLMKVWFSHTDKKVFAYIQTESPPPAATGLYLEITASPGEGEVASSPIGCLRWVVLIAGEVEGQQTTWQGPRQAKLLDHCNDGDTYGADGVWAELRAIQTLEDGTGLITIIAPRRYSPLLGDCRVLAAPQAATKDLVGQDDAVSLGFATGATLDTTKVGADHQLAPTKGSIRKGCGPSF
jgi:hypothetical protein